MLETNPYDSPRTTADPVASNPAPLLWSVAVVFGAAFVGGLIGLGLGAAIGTMLPGYYRSVFSGGSDPNFDPVAVGIGQGLTQGVVFGGITGLLLVGMFYWYRVQMQRNQQSPFHE